MVYFYVLYKFCVQKSFIPLLDLQNSCPPVDEGCHQLSSPQHPRLVQATSLSAHGCPGYCWRSPPHPATQVNTRQDAYELENCVVFPSVGGMLWFKDFSFGFSPNFEFIRKSLILLTMLLSIHYDGAFQNDEQMKQRSCSRCQGRVYEVYKQQDVSCTLAGDFGSTTIIKTHSNMTILRRCTYF